MTRRVRGAPAWAATLALVACSPRADTTRDTASVGDAASTVDVMLPDSASIRDAMAALDAFLDASREGSATRASLGGLTACPTGDAPAPGPMLGAYELLSATTRADTIVGRAVVTTVAEQDVDRQHPGYFVARVRVRSDTLEWDVLRAESGNWVVCNGLKFGLTAPDSLTTWRPSGASVATARALADSLAHR